MADIRCQMCGKLNPSNLDVCQFCQARLRPVWESAQPEEEPLAGSGGEGDEIPEWLRSLRSPDMGAGETPSGSGLDWLSDVEPDEFAADAVKNVFDLEPEEKLDDWLSGAASLAEPESPKAEDSFDQVRSELSFLEETPFSSAAPEEEETPDWLDRFRDEQGEETPERMDFSPAGQEQPSPEEAPDWLARIQEAQMGDWSPPQEPASEPESWSPESQPEETVPEFTPSEEAPGWFTEPAPASEAGEEAFGEAEEPDFGAIFTPETQPESAESQQGVPDWLASLYSGQEEAPSPFMAEPEAAEPETPSAAEKAELPDWLSGVAETSAEPAAAAGGIYTAPLEDEFPQTGAEGEAAEESKPDWLSELEAQGASALEGQSPPPFTPAFDDFNLEEFSVGEETPDWLSKLEASSSAQPSEEAVAAFLFEGKGETPFTTEPPGEALPQVDAFTGLPEWLSEVTQAEEPEEHPEESGKAQALAPTELPAWLESMRPVEPAASATPFKDATDSRVERSGPLSGLSGVLPVGAHAIRAGKPSNFSIKLQVTEELQNRALLLQKLMEDESKPKPLPAPSAAPTPYLIRLGLFAVLALAVFFALFLGGGQIPLPVGKAIPQSLNDAYRQITTLPDNAAVLLAVDYSPGYVGEIEGAAQAVVQHLAGRGASLAAISTNPSGPALAERLLQNIDPALAAANQFHNLGYLPGGTAGLFGFAQSPEAMVPFDLQGKPFWQQEPLNPQLGIRNFAMLVVMTENAETARTWIEQVAPAMSPAPVLMVLSAQAEPMILPYYQGKPQQVSGMVVGLAGGAAYENLINRPGDSSRAWDAFSLLVTVSLAVLLIGSLASAALGAITRGKQSKVESSV